MYSLRPSQMSYILPGRDFTQEDLETVLSESSRHVSDGNDALMMAAWEVAPSLSPPKPPVLPSKCALWLPRSLSLGLQAGLTHLQKGCTMK